MDQKRLALVHEYGAILWYTAMSISFKQHVNVSEHPASLHTVHDRQLKCTN